MGSWTRKVDGTLLQTMIQRQIVLCSLFDRLDKGLEASNGTTKNERVDIALALVCLCHKQVGDVSADVVLVAGGVATKYFLQPAQD